MAFEEWLEEGGVLMLELGELALAEEQLAVELGDLAAEVGVGCALFVEFVGELLD